VGVLPAQDAERVVKRQIQNVALEYEYTSAEVPIQFRRVIVLHRSLFIIHRSAADWIRMYAELY